MTRQQEFVLRTVEEHDIRFIRLWFTDILGYLKSVVMSPSELENAFDEGVGFDGSSIEGFSRVAESDIIALPDPSTFQVLPFDADNPEIKSARMFCDITTPDEHPSLSDPRQVLRKQVRQAADEGFTCMISPEIEFYLIKQNADITCLEPTDTGGYFDQSSNNVVPKFRREAMVALESMGIATEFSHHEAAPGQQEIDLRHADVLTMADSLMTFRFLIKQVAVNSGVRATFMPKPFTHQAGSALHSHISLFEGDTNAFHDPDDEISLSQTGRQFIAGVLRHSPEISAVTNQWPNSYKRIVFGNEAPIAATWGISNRSALVRVPTYRLNKAESRRVEVRSLDSACNPYLAYSLILAAGLKGIREEYVLDEPAEDDISLLTRRERLAMSYEDLPASLDQALRLLEKSEFAADVLGEQIYEYFLRTKWKEWHSYQEQITSWELRNTLDY